MLGEVAEKAASAFMKLEHDQFRRRIAALEGELETVAARTAATGPFCPGPSNGENSTLT